MDARSVLINGGAAIGEQVARGVGTLSPDERQFKIVMIVRKADIDDKFYTELERSSRETDGVLLGMALD